MEKCFEVLERQLPKISKIYLNSKIEKKSVLWKIFNSKKYFIELKSKLKDMKISDKTVFIFSTGEGFEIGNLEKWFPKAYQSNKKVSIQHGVFILDYDIKKELARNFINFFSNLFFNFNLLGKGFGGTKFDKYLVHGKRYEEYLIKQKKWLPQNIVVGGCLLRPISKEKFNSGDCCVLLLQPLVEINIVSAEKFNYYIKKILKELKNNYTKIVIRLHPKMNYKDYSFLLKEGVEISCSKNIEDDFKRAEIAVSFFSTALIDAYLKEIPVVGVSIPEINKKYFNFIEKVVAYDNININKNDYSKYKIKTDEIDILTKKDEALLKLLN